MFMGIKNYNGKPHDVHMRFIDYGGYEKPGIVMIEYCYPPNETYTETHKQKIRVARNHTWLLNRIYNTL